MAITKVTDSLVDFDSLEILTSASDTGVDLTLNGNKSSNGAVASIIFENNTDSVAMIRASRVGGNNDAADMQFFTQATGGSNSERMRLDSTGGLFFGMTSKTTSVTNGGVYINGDYSVGSTNYYAQMFMQHNISTNHGFVIKGLNTNGIPMAFQNSSGTVVGTITNNASSTAFNTSSDYRLKENVVDMTGAITRVKELQPRRFNWIEDETNTLVDGFIAHEASTVVPEAVTGNHNETKTAENAVLSSDGSVFADGVTEDEWTAGKTGDNPKFPSDSTWTASHTFPVYQGIDQAKLVPLLTGALQEAITKIEALETRIETLENA